MKVAILDYGYIELIEAWGTGRAGTASRDYECGIIESARQSTQGSFRGWESDVKLLKYLSTNKHDSVFEFAGAVFEVQAPIFVFRNWMRHRTQSYSELSARYSPVPDVNYTPTVKRCMVVSPMNKQAGPAQGSASITHNSALAWLEKLDECYQMCEKTYQLGLQTGIPKEVARVCVPVGRYSRMRASANLRNWLAFMTLRDAPDAQEEIRLYAQAMSSILREVFPQVMKLFEKKRDRVDV